jgi:glycosyltransferase involved in cell wall biosynthesis
MKKAVVCVTNDLVTDQRVQRTISVLQSKGYSVTFVGRLLPNSLPVEMTCETRRFRLWFKRGFLFYATYNIRLFLFLLFRSYDLYLANDLDTLLPNFLWSQVRRKPLIYDAHEYFTGVPEIQDRPVVKWVWTSLEKIIFPRLSYVVTVNGSIAGLYETQYGIRPKVVRNISDSRLPEKVKSREELGIPPSAYILINQGAGINVDRGMEEMLGAMKELPEDVHLLLVGKGDVVDLLKDMVLREELEGRVSFVPTKPYMEMLQYTLNADCGLSLDKPLSPNYQYSLPNKVFDYVKSGIPVLGSNVIEVSTLINHYSIGEVCEEVEPGIIAKKIMQIRKNGKDYYRSALQKTAIENNWEKEQLVWEQLIDEIDQSEHR